jgi:hypothetical protein
VKRRGKMDEKRQAKRRHERLSRVRAGPLHADMHAPLIIIRYIYKCISNHVKSTLSCGWIHGYYL